MQRIVFYSLNWSITGHTGIVVLLLVGETQTRTIPVNNAAEFTAIASILRSDPDHAVFFDPNNGVFTSGKDAA